MPKICVGVNIFVEVDEIDWLELTFLCTWGIVNSRGRLYATGVINGKHTLMHLLIGQRMQLSPSQLIDHKDGNTFNNKRENLRNATRAQNNANSKMYKNNFANCKGVSWHNNKWRARINYKGRTIHIGYFHTLEEAKSAYSQAAKKYYGEFANDGE